MAGGNRSQDDKVQDWVLPVIGILIALAIAWGIGQLQARETYKRQHIPTAYAAAAKKDAERTCIGTDPSVVFRCVNEKVETAYQTAHDEQDLSAQQRAASSALATTILSFMALVLSGVGVWFVKRTLDATLLAVADTGKATAEMVEANRIARSSKRPIMTLVDGGIKYVESIIAGSPCATIYVVGDVKNIGDAVGILIRIDLELFCDEHPMQRGDTSALENPLLLPGEKTGPSHGFWGGSGGSIESVAPYGHPTGPLKHTLRLRAKIRYQDLHGTFRANGCFFIRSNNAAGRPFVAYGGPSEWYDREISKEEAYQTDEG